MAIWVRHIVNGVIWITGLAGAGKTSIASEVVRQLRELGQPCVLLDGDVLRAIVGEGRHDRESRLAMAYRIARLAALIGKQGIAAVVATISLFHEVHAFNRSVSTHYFEVIVNCPLATLKQRHTIYNSVDLSEVVGIGIEPEFPKAPHWSVDNSGNTSRFDVHATALIAAWIAHVGL